MVVSYVVVVGYVVVDPYHLGPYRELHPYGFVVVDPYAVVVVSYVVVVVGYVVVVVQVVPPECWGRVAPAPVTPKPASTRANIPASIM